MKRPHNRQRMKFMHKMLFEMARGNFNNQIPLSQFDDEMEALVVLLNMVAEELKESVFYSGFVNPFITYKMVTCATFILDENDAIKNVNQGVIDILGYDEIEMVGRPIDSFIKADFGDISEQEKKAMKERLFLGEIITLHFVTNKMLIVSAECSISRLSDGTSTVLNFVVPYLEDSENTEESFDLKLNKHPSLRKADARLMQLVYDYVLANLATPLPSVKELARKFGTNDCKLKDGFKYFFHTSIYQFYTEERLKRAYIMIEQTDIPLKNISFMNGFNTYPNFSRTFKKRYGFSPKEVGRGEVGDLFIN